MRDVFHADVGKRSVIVLIVGMNSRERFLAAAQCRAVDRPPVWVMRQAGRYLPEYRAVRAKRSFEEMVHAPEIAAEITLQPIRRFGFDAAIVFSDILAVPEAMGQAYSLREGEGIRMEFALKNASQIDALVPDAGVLRERLVYVAQALGLVRRELGTDTALLGFAGSPWTLACYMIEGGGAKNGGFTKAARMFADEPRLFTSLMEKLSAVVAEHLAMQISAGADAVQIFDSWAAACPDSHYEEMSLCWIRRTIERLPRDVPVILFAKGMSRHVAALAATGAKVLSFDDETDIRAMADALPSSVAVQGNLPPALTEDTPECVRLAVSNLLNSMRGRDGHIVNLGHGIRPDARLDAVEALVRGVRNFR